LIAVVWESDLRGLGRRGAADARLPLGAWGFFEEPAFATVTIAFEFLTQSSQGFIRSRFT
jgi:hypothetical protein